ncbi:PTS galactosamine/N-acetylgalactosamine transporter subunit IIA [Psychromonas hadalis]|uniref:PTS galactosamine/N-acetylgalactosamine transporter subunit IIA n=1 Tax=Psychromonas hadalis TaxID=211669 RepID=UPI0003F888A0|nr:PTS galactosamine/N-acetylgalactosamine transporter subunit IIA [Psychromonas hadalis]
MIGVIVTGHGQFAYGMQKAVERIIGEQEHVAFIDFPIESSTEILTEQLSSAIDKTQQGKGVVFFTDLLGGTPFRAASLLSNKQDDVEVLTGINLQMLIEMLLERDDQELTVTQFREQAIVCGLLGLTSLYDQLEKKKKSIVENNDDDGI